MAPVVAVIAQGGMGAAVGARLSERGVRVLTSLAGRSAVSAQRAKAAGMDAVSDAEIAAADFILSVVPPQEALPLAMRLAPALRAANRKPLYADCNAVNPETVKRIGVVLAEAGCPFVDGGIIGGPPRASYIGPVFYVCGGDADRLAILNDYGLIIRILPGPVGAASAVKMSFGGITKGLTAIGSAMILAANRAGVGEALHVELSASQPAVLNYLTRSVPDMFPKAYRWVSEMEEIADFTGNEAERDMYRAIAALYERLAKDMEGKKMDIAALDSFFPKPN